MKRILVLTVMFFSFLPAASFTQDKEAEARKLYLQASRSVRAEEYKKAERLLDKILSDYIDTDIALKADDLLSSIGDKLKAGNLPKTPGYYVLLKNGELIRLEKLRVKEGLHNGQYINYVTFEAHTVVQIYADEFDKFYVYNPKADLSDIKWAGLTKPEVPEGQEPGDDWIIFENFYVPTKQGRFTYDEVVFNELKTGLFEVSFPEDFSPTQSSAALLRDGTSYAGVVWLHQKMVDAMYPGLLSWEPDDIRKGANFVRQLLTKYPEKAELHLFAGTWSYKNDYMRENVPTEAKQAAVAGLRIAASSTETEPQAIEHLKAMLQQCRIDSAIAAIAPTEGDSQEQLSSKINALNKFEWDAVNNSNYRWFEAKAQIYHRLGDYEKALVMCNRALQEFKDFGEKGKSFLGGRISILSRSDLQQEKATGFYIQKALNNFSKDYKKKSEKLKKYIESEQILAQVEQGYVGEGTGDPKKGLKLVDKARKKYKRNEHVYLVRAALYEKLGDQKKMEKALKEADKVRRKNEKEREKMAGKKR